AAVAELRDRLSWRERLTLLGADVPSGIDTAALMAWAKSVVGTPSPWARRIAPCLVGLVLLTAVGWSAGWPPGWLGPLAFGVALLLQGGFALLVKRRVRRALDGVHGRAYDLFHLTHVLACIEREEFHAALLRREP